MEKIILKNKIFEYFLIGFLIILLVRNLYALGTGNLIGIITCGIQGLLLFLILTKNKFGKIGIEVWAIILVLSNGISLLAKLIKALFGNEIPITVLFKKLIFLTIGILIYIFSKKYVEIVKVK